MDGPIDAAVDGPVEAPIDATAPGEIDAVGLELFALDLDLELEPLELDDGVELDLTPAADARFPQDFSADEIAPVVDALPAADATAKHAVESADDVVPDGVAENTAEIVDAAPATVPQMLPASEPFASPVVAEITQTPEAAEIAALGRRA